MEHLVGPALSGFGSLCSLVFCTMTYVTTLAVIGGLVAVHRVVHDVFEDAITRPSSEMVSEDEGEEGELL